MSSDNTPSDMLGRKAILPLASALDQLQSQLKPVAGEEEVSLEESLGRVLARGITAPEDLPSHDRSVMDGFAVKASDTFGSSEALPAYLDVSGEVIMGKKPETGPGPGQCHRIATGGILPPGTDAVVMLEHTVAAGEHMVEITQSVAAGENVLKAGEDVTRGSIIFTPGHAIRPQDMGLLAGLGIGSLHVRPRLRVGIISTGDEIVPCNESPPPGKIRDINAVNLKALSIAAGCLVSDYGIVPDHEPSLEAAVLRAVSECDLVIISGGSSVGARDIGERVISRLEPPGILAHGVAIKPGKPVIIAFAGDTPVFGLPGHPVAASVTFDLFVLPAIKGRAGLPADSLPEWRTVRARLMRNINSSAGRTDFVRVRVVKSNNEKDHPYQAHPVLGKSGAISTMVHADGYVVIQSETQGIKCGEMVTVNLFH